jgi:hypothetical protein
MRLNHRRVIAVADPLLVLRHKFIAMSIMQMMITGLVVLAQEVAPRT